jgi:hypothetical protein
MGRRDPADPRRHPVRQGGLELRIVGHDVLAAGIFNLHSNVLPYFYRNCSMRKIAVDLLDGVGSEGWAIKLIWIERCAEPNMAMAAPHQRKSFVDLRLQLLAIRQRVIHHQNVLDFQVQTFKHLLKCGIGLKYMNMDVDRMNGSEGVESHLFRGRIVLAGGGRGLSHGIQGDA